MHAFTGEKSGAVYAATLSAAVEDKLNKLWYHIATQAGRMAKIVRRACVRGY